MSSKLTLNSSCSSIDFRMPITPTFTINTTSINQAQVDVLQGKAMWAGNALYDNQVIYQGTLNDINVIYQEVINAPNNILISPSYKLKGYYHGDINMSGEVIFQGTANDVEFIYQNITKNHPGNTLKLNYFKIKEQLP